MTQTSRIRIAGLTCAATALGLLGLAVPATAGSGGLSATGSDAPTGKKAKIANDGTAIPPRGAPPRVVRVIRAANKIEDKPYLWGGGHGRWNDKGYDCSGAVSYALHGGGFIDSQFPGVDFDTWGRKGTGKWISVYASSDHIYMTVAGLRWDTSYTEGDGPGWSAQPRPNGGFDVRHPARW